MTENGDSEGKLRALANKISSLESGQLPSIERLIKKPISLPEARYYFTKLVMWSFVLFLFAVAAFIMVDGDKDKVTALTEILKTMYLPVVTLTLGYYFGTKSE